MREFVQALIICQRNDVASYICNRQWEWLLKSLESESPCEIFINQAAGRMRLKLANSSFTSTLQNIAWTGMKA